jgi:hypothetical protein
VAATLLLLLPRRQQVQRRPARLLLLQQACWALLGLRVWLLLSRVKSGQGSRARHPSGPATGQHRHPCLPHLRPPPLLLLLLLLAVRSWRLQHLLLLSAPQALLRLHPALLLPAAARAQLPRMRPMPRRRPRAALPCAAAAACAAGTAAAAGVARALPGPLPAARA